jgi:hypothetical protein
MSLHEVTEPEVTSKPGYTSMICNINFEMIPYKKIPIFPREKAGHVRSSLLSFTFYSGSPKTL